MKFCIVGSGRCGTSLLRAQMNQHPDVWVHGETHWLPRMIEYAGLAACDTQVLVHILRQTTHTTGERVTPIEDDELARLFADRPRITVRTFANRVGQALATRHGKTIWADKVPDYGFFMQQIQMLWPDCRFIHLIRDGRDVALSMSQHPGFQWIVTAGEATWCSAAFQRYFEKVTPAEHPLSAYAARWSHAIGRIRDEATRLTPGTYYEVHYEALLADTPAVLAKLAEFAGIAVDPAWLEVARRRINPAKVRPARDPAVGAAMTGEASQWMRELGYF